MVKDEIEELEQWRLYMSFLYAVKDIKIPFYDKLPKDNQFYKHFMQNLNHNKI